ncbi:MAG: hypothetical protein ACPGJV_08705 [Bacteriovoracaceae bacterium]
MKSIVLLASLIASSSLWAYGTGLSTAPMVKSKKYVSAELTGVTSTGGGVGLQARFTQQATRNVVFDAGIGMSGGDYDNRLFVGADYLIFPDYQKQPRFSVKATLENAEELDSRRNIVGLAPTVSKGFNFWGTEAYPFLALPINLNLNTDSKNYETTIAANLGILGQLPIQGYEHLTYSVEGTIKLKDSLSGIFLSIGYPID